MLRWHILTVEYPPAYGGVADYTRQLAQALVDAGDDVTVWVPGQGLGAAEAAPCGCSLPVHRLPDRFGPRSRDLLGRAWHASPGIVLLQYVPTAIGTHGTNVAFCRWLAAQRTAGLDVRVIFHEPYVYFSARRPWLNAAALAQRAMAALLIRASEPVYVSTETWLRYLKPYGASAVRVLPMPATIPAAASTSDISRFRIASGARAGEIVIGHFGTYGDHVTRELVPALLEIAARLTTVRFALLGAGSKSFLQRLRTSAPSVAEHACATDRLQASDVAAALRACDLVLQPYPDGVTTRRTSVMAALINGVPTLTTQGRLTESIWMLSRAVSLARAGRPSEIADAAIRLADNATARAELGMQGRRFYDAHFAMERTLETLRGSVPASAPALTMAQ